MSAATENGTDFLKKIEKKIHTHVSIYTCTVHLHVVLFKFFFNTTNIVFVFFSVKVTQSVIDVGRDEEKVRTQGICMVSSSFIGPDNWTDILTLSGNEAGTDPDNSTLL